MTEGKKTTPLKLARITEGLTQAQLADIIGMETRALAKLEAGQPVRNHLVAVKLYTYFLNRGHKMQLLDIFCPKHVLMISECLKLEELKPVDPDAPTFTPTTMQDMARG